MLYVLWDLGSNTLKHFIVKKGKDGEVEIIKEKGYGTRLVEGVSSEGFLQDASMQRTWAILKILREETEGIREKKMFAVATSAVRDAKNSQLFLKKASEILGFPVRLLSGKEEAELIFLGVRADSVFEGKRVFVIDIGGGSVEVVESNEAGEEKQSMSLPLGCVRLREGFISEYPLKEGEREGLYQSLHAQLGEALASYSLDGQRLVFCGGSVLSFFAIQRGLSEIKPSQINGGFIEKQELEKGVKKLSGMTLAELKRIGVLAGNRADIIVPALIFVHVVMEILGASKFYVSTKGLRYGVLEEEWKK